MTLRKKDVNLVFSVIPLIILSLSALIFHTPEKLNKISNGMPKTYQYHSILFALRSFVIIIIISFFGNTKFTNFLVVCILFLTMKGADEINRLFKYKEDKSAWKVTEVPFWSGRSHLWNARIFQDDTRFRIRLKTSRINS